MIGSSKRSEVEFLIVAFRAHRDLFLKRALLKTKHAQLWLLVPSESLLIFTVGTAVCSNRNATEHSMWTNSLIPHFRPLIALTENCKRLHRSHRHKHLDSQQLRMHHITKVTTPVRNALFKIPNTESDRKTSTRL